MRHFILTLYGLDDFESSPEIEFATADGIFFATADGAIFSLSPS
jgi:hypothetical protein